MWVCFKAPGYFLWERLCVSIPGKGGSIPLKEINFKPGVFLLHWEHISLISGSVWGSCVWDLSGTESASACLPQSLATGTSLRQMDLPASPSALKLTASLNSAAQPRSDFLLPFSSASLCPPPPRMAASIFTEASTTGHIDRIDRPGRWFSTLGKTLKPTLPV